MIPSIDEACQRNGVVLLTCMDDVRFPDVRLRDGTEDVMNYPFNAKVMI